jgi:hypothetical protein
MQSRPCLCHQIRLADREAPQRVIGHIHGKRRAISGSCVSERRDLCNQLDALLDGPIIDLRASIV